MSLGYLLDSCFSYCLQKTTSTFKLEDVYYFVGNEQIDDVTKRNDSLILRGLTQVFYWNNNTFKLGLKVLLTQDHNLDLGF
jgi:hypothetical protein